MQQEKKPEKSTDLLMLAREAAQRELETLRGRLEKPKKQTLLTGHRRFWDA